MALSLGEQLYRRTLVRPGGCWLWTGRLTSDGYGIVKWGSVGQVKSMVASRAAYIVAKGEIDRALTVDHLCYNPACINPAHLEAVTIQENIRRRRTHGRKRGGFPVLTRADIRALDPNPALSRLAGFCGRGHPLSGPNLYVKPNGQRHCRACRTTYHTRYMRSRRAHAKAVS